MSRTEVLEEAIALERAGGRWQVRHVIALVDRCASFIRNSDCPKHTEPPGKRSKKGRGKTVFVPAEVRDWYAAQLDQQHEPRVRLSA